MISVHEDEVAAVEFPDRWSKDLIGTKAIPTTAGFNLGRACYTATEFGTPQIHTDQEAVYVLSGIGEMKAGEQIIALRPGVAVYIAPGVPHCARRTSAEPVHVVYCHGAI